ncbi:MAG: exodeoxyribonuclease VII large subunit [Bacillota bacterium]
MPVFTVTDVTRRIQELLDGDPVLGTLWVRGEISNLSIAASGHLYFTLKDQASQLRAVMFRSRAQTLAFPVENGLMVIVRGRVSLYERDGKVQLYANEMEPDGIGIQSILLRELRTRLEKEGLFDPGRKRALPRFPRRIGVATSSEGAAVRDISETLRRRWPLAEVVVAPCTVQGTEAPLTITAALERLNRDAGVDVIIVGRGGGSQEELFAFNTEVVVRGIFGSRVPVVSAVGHERDVTLADLAADARAATPSAAAALAAPNRAEISEHINHLAERLRTGVLRRYELLQFRFNRACQSRVFSRPWETIYGEAAQTVDGLAARLEYRMRSALDKTEKHLAVLQARMEALNPSGTLSRGYSICLRATNGEVITDSNQVSPGEIVEVLLRQGRLSCKVEGCS